MAYPCAMVMNAGSAEVADSEPGQSEMKINIGPGISNTMLPAEFIGDINWLYRFDYIHLRTAAGFMFNRKISDDVSSSGFASFSIGTGVNFPWFYAGIYTGVGFITHPDRKLGSNFQFFQDVEMGVRDDKGRTFGVFFKHVSNAGIVPPNIGRDYFGLSVGIPVDFGF